MHKSSSITGYFIACLDQGPESEVQSSGPDLFFLIKRVPLQEYCMSAMIYKVCCKKFSQSCFPSCGRSANIDDRFFNEQGRQLLNRFMSGQVSVSCTEAPIIVLASCPLYASVHARKSLSRKV
jgi:hypothetical protein